MKMLKLIVQLLMLCIVTLVIVLFILRFMGVNPQSNYQSTVEAIEIYGFPMVILLSLFLTLDKRNGIRRNISWVIVTPILSYTCIFLMSIVMLFSTQHWIDFTIAYQNKKDPNRTIREQLLDLGAHGYADRGRVVEVRSTLGFFEYCIPVDTNKLQKNEWRYVNRDGDISFP